MTSPQQNHHSPGDRLQAAIHALPDDGVTLAEVRDIAGRDGLMLLTIFLTVVFLVPISIPGVSTVFGAGILLIALSRLFRRDLRLPGRLERRVVETHRLRGALLQYWPCLPIAAYGQAASASSNRMKGNRKCVPRCLREGLLWRDRNRRL